MTFNKLKISGLLCKEPGSFLLLLSLVTLAYLNSFAGVFQFDDFNVIVNNSRVHTFAAWLSDLPRGIRPLLKLSWLINWQSGLGIFGFHLVNLAIHLGNTALVYLLAKSLYPEHEQSSILTIPFVAAVIFGLHPLQTEAVTYICGRSVALMTFFYLTAVYYGMQSSEGATARLKWSTLVIFIAAMAVKETAITLPLALLLTNFWKNGFTRSTLLNSIKAQWPSWLLMFLLPAILILHPRYGALLEYSFDIRSWQDNVMGQINAICYLASRLFILNGMNIDPDLTTVLTRGLSFYLKFAAISAVTITALFSIRKAPWFTAGFCWFVVHLIPTNSIVPRLDLVNDRQAYLPMVGVSIIIAILISQYCQAWRSFIVAFLILLLSGFTVSRNNLYRSEIALWEDIVAKSPQNARAFNNLGYAYSIARKDQEGCSAYLQAITLKPDYDLAKANLARFCR